MHQRSAHLGSRLRETSAEGGARDVVQMAEGRLIALSAMRGTASSR